MAHIRTIDPDSATGPLRRSYDSRIRRAGRLWNIVRIMGLNPSVLDAAMKLYETTMYGPSPLSRRQREMLAVVTSGVNECHY
jgi:alkylhydroperoxidase family enzyme